MTVKCKANPPTKKAVKIKENMMVAKDEWNRKSVYWMKFPLRTIMKFQRWKVVMILKCYLLPWDHIYI